MYTVPMTFDKYTNHKTILSVNALITSGSKFLMNKRPSTKAVDQGLYSGVGGKVEPGEDFFTAMMRELEEETGIKNVLSIRPYAVCQHPYPPTDSEWVSVYFYIELAEMVDVPSTEDGEFIWMTPGEIMTVPTPTDLKRYFSELQKNPKAFILGFHNHDEKGNLIEESVKVY